MVHYFRTRCSTYQLYMGKDKYENEELIKYGWPEDVWFHVDDLSSAHVYLRMKPGQTLSDIPEDVLLDCCSLVKANSIAGCKKSEVYVVYTRWKNLKKTPGTAEGQVGFHRPENVKRLKVEKNGPIVRQIEKTKIVDDNPNLYEKQQQRLAEIQRQKKAYMKEQQKQEAIAKQKAAEEKEARSYDRLFANASNQMTSVSDQQATADETAAEEYEDDFF